MTRHTISVTVEDKPGVLAKISGMCALRGFNIRSLAVGPIPFRVFGVGATIFDLFGLLAVLTMLGMLSRRVRRNLQNLGPSKSKS